MTSGAIWIFGAGGQALEVHELASRLAYSVAGFIDPFDQKGVLEGLPVVPQLPAQPASVTLGVGSPELRQRIRRTTPNGDLDWPSLVDPDAVVARSAEVAGATIVQAHAYVGPRCEIGEGALINYGATVGHHATLAPFCVVLPGTRISGRVRVGEAATLGAGCVVLPGVAIGSEAVVGAGAVVTKDVRRRATVVGIPAREVSPR